MKKVIALTLLLVTLISLSACEKTKSATPNVDNIRSICELATLECFYNNVAEIKKEADNIFQVDRVMWIEYEGKATIGIDMADLDIKISGQTVNIKMPDAKILSTDYTFMEDSYVASSKGWIWPNKISTEEQRDGVIQGQEKMIQSIKENKMLFVKAEDKAKELIENYITRLGEVSDVEYTIVWSK